MPRDRREAVIYAASEVNCENTFVATAFENSDPRRSIPCSGFDVRLCAASANVDFASRQTRNFCARFSG